MAGRAQPMAVAIGVRVPPRSGRLYGGASLGWLVPLAVPTPYLFCLVKRERWKVTLISFVSFLISLEPRNDMSRKETRELDPTWYMFWTIVFIDPLISIE
ncbi:hypothetical protein OIU77_000316 [Salix suchowensis]|uniref:Uncharacterized protein n=1 Tax=Salix suchowensis TaxID=1278906 RepID=A0ABQ9B808_9ROSI|nr:hypothetical protein OIU77_000316 [Salix suchowensis]